MAEFTSDIDTIIESADIIEREFILKVQNGYQGSYTEVPVLENGFSLSRDKDSYADQLEISIVNEDFEFSDEHDHDNPIQEFADVEFYCRVYKEDGTYEEKRVFKGYISEPDPADFDLDVVCLGKLDRINRATAGIDAPIEREALVADTITTPQLWTPWEYIDGASPLGIVTFTDGSATVTGDANAKFQDNLVPGDYIRSRPVGLPPLFKKWYQVESIESQTSLTLTENFAKENGANPSSTCAKTIYDPYTMAIDPTLHSTAVDDNGIRRAFRPRGMRIEEDEAGGSVEWNELPPDAYIFIDALGLIKFYDLPDPTSTFRIYPSAQVYREGTGLAEDIIEEGLRVSKADGGPGFTDTELTESCTGTINISNVSLQVDGNSTSFLSELSSGDRIKPTAESDWWGVVDSVESDTKLYLAYYYQGSTTGTLLAFEKSTLRSSFSDISYYKWSANDGYISDIINDLRKNHMPKNYYIWHDPDADKVRGDLITIKDTADHILYRPISVPEPRSADAVHTRVLVSGEIERPLNLMENATITELYDGTWTNLSGEWNGVTYGSTDNLKDVDLTTGHGTGKVISPPPEPEDYETYHEYLKIDFGALKNVGKIHLYGMGPRNPQKFACGITVEISEDDSTYLEVSPEALEAEIKPGGELILEDLVYNYGRYIKISMRPTKWVVDGDDIHMGLCEIRIFEPSDITVEAKIHDDADLANKVWTLPDGTEISTYYPDLVSKTSEYGYVTLAINNASFTNEIEAKDRAYMELDEAIQHYQAVEVRLPFDPRINLFQTIQITNTYTSGDPVTRLLLVEEIILEEDETVIIGVDYSGGVLE